MRGQAPCSTVPACFEAMLRTAQVVRKVHSLCSWSLSDAGQMHPAHGHHVISTAPAPYSWEPESRLPLMLPCKAQPPDRSRPAHAGCDAFSVHLILAAVACSLNLGPSWKAVVGSMLIMTPWALAHWEEYHCGTMLYGNGYWGLTEANYALVILHWVTAWVRRTSQNLGQTEHRLQTLTALVFPALDHRLGMRISWIA